MQHLPGLADEAVAALKAGDPQALIDFHRLAFGGWRMEADDDADDQDDQSEDDADEDSEDDKLAPEDDPKSIEYWKKRSRQNEREAKRAKRERDEAKKAAPAKPAKKADDGDDDKPDVDKIREDAKAEAQREALHGRVEDKIEAKARAFADPEDAVAVLLRSHDIEDFIDDGKVDVDAITEALGDLAEKKPHLLAKGKKFEGDGDGGARPNKPGRPKDLGEALSRQLSGSK